MTTSFMRISPALYHAGGLLSCFTGRAIVFSATTQFLYTYAFEKDSPSPPLILLLPSDQAHAILDIVVDDVVELFLGEAIVLGEDTVDLIDY